MKVVILLPQQWCVLLLFLLPAVAEAAAAPPPPLFNISQPECQDKCGDESVPYPFGFGRSECFKSSSFELNCNCDKDQKCKLSQGGFKIENIFMENGTATIYVPMHYSCYNSFRPGETFYYSGPGNTSYYYRCGNRSYYSQWGNTSYCSRYASWVGTNNSAFTISSKQNKFTALGCSIVAGMGDSNRKSFMTGCFSACYGKVNLTEEDGGGGCTGRGCCRTQIPRGSKFLYMSLRTTPNSVSRKFSPCSYAFVSNQDWIGFTNISLTNTSNVNHTSPAVVDWVVGNETCESSKNSSTYACRDNTNCNNSYNGPGYFCSCKQGYQGNPYLGCQDIDECKDKKDNCEGTCKNTEGSFTCHCPLGTHVDDKGACKGFRLTTLAVVIGVCLSLVVVIFFLWMACKLRNKTRNFLKNGGNLLDNHEIIIYKEKDLKKATKNYHQDQLLGKGGSGFVYKGKLLNKEVAIKKPKVDPDIGRGGIRQYFRSREKLDHNFQNEIKMICKVYHKNIVKLVGLCLETKVPILVYEFIPNDSLYHHIHSPQSSRLNSWKNRLSIAYNTAVALDYLHSKAGDTSIIHGDVKSKNILLDKNFTPKVADFGASVTVTLKQNSFSITKVQGTRGNLDSEFFLTKLQGTRGYMDPEYRSTGVLTVKSDVYSFGVVLMELLTSKKPISGERPIDQVEYVPYFIFSVEDDKLGQVMYCKLEDEDQKMKLQVEAVAKLAVKCLNRSSLGRPDMDEVEKELGKLNARNSGVRVDQSNNIIEEKESIVSVDCSDNISMPSCSS